MSTNNGKGGNDWPTAFVRKAIAQSERGVGSVLVLPAQSYIGLLLDAGATLYNAGRVRWLEVETGEPCRDPSPIITAVLPAKTGSGSEQGAHRRAGQLERFDEAT